MAPLIRRGDGYPWHRADGRGCLQATTIRANPDAESERLPEESVPTGLEAACEVCNW